MSQLELWRFCRKVTGHAPVLLTVSGIFHVHVYVYNKCAHDFVFFTLRTKVQMYMFCFKFRNPPLLIPNYQITK